MHRGDSSRESFRDGGRPRRDSWNNRRRTSSGRPFGGDNETAMNPSEEPVSFEKNFYFPTETLSEKEARELRESNRMRLVGNDIPLPIRSFSSVSFPEEVLRHFEAKGYANPTPIQAQGWPMALSGRDMVGIADTGSGKTISFVLPALIHAQSQPPLREDDGPIVLILAPTRELCTQIETVVREYTPYYNLRSCAVYGGASIVPQKRALKRGIEVLVATPGRLIDLHKQGFCPLGRVTFLVLDEADRMLDMGFEPQLNAIIPQTNENRQNLMWSATWPREVRALAANYMKDYIQVTIGDEDLKANVKIVQKVDIVDWQDKKKKLLYYLQDFKTSRVIVFCNMKKTCDTLEDYLLDNRFHVAALHGDKSQAARDTVIQNFKSGRISILIATDVAARGLDVENVKCVINYDFPKNIEDYVHRIGRTARGSSSEGLAYTMFTGEDAPNARKLIDIIRQANQTVPTDLESMVRSSRGRVLQSNYRSSSRSQHGSDRRGSFAGGYGERPRRSFY
ncbi:uncharacterized protein VICG_02033 [Vittaforma corneae ATCC 50505]|uniref:RNA helicase n=1 Tax=Vittaforma corneae (strain ATCC 50505) TaxID=993615 RepID=L2GJY1_VITCO|nr:uncharacterized protein VICG_02033 [Vittaforma corneae ATCC 50505]ELA40944.1 hypothetical protein VICG_02033 [Vittaforma corneae ATCC 50505]